jgi:hypothetical protein
MVDLLDVAVESVSTSSNLGFDGKTLHMRGMSRSQSNKNCQKHVTDRVRIFVESDIFRKIKFFNSDASFQKAINLVMITQISGRAAWSFPDAIRECFQ